MNNLFRNIWKIMNYPNIYVFYIYMYIYIYVTRTHGYNCSLRNLITFQNSIEKHIDFINIEIPTCDI